MLRPNYRDFRRSKLFVVTESLRHSADGSSWKEHKYIKRIDGTYYYPDSYEGGRHLPDSEKESDDLSKKDVDTLAKEVIRGNFGNGQQRKDLLGESYAEVQKRVNELMKSSVGSKKISEATSTSISVAEEAAKRAVALVEKYRNKKEVN